MVGIDLSCSKAEMRSSEGDGEGALGDGGLQGDKDWVARGGRVGEALVEHAAPGGEEARGGCGVGYFVAKIVGRCRRRRRCGRAVRERGEGEGGDVEVFVVGGGEGLDQAWASARRACCRG